MITARISPSSFVRLISGASNRLMLNLNRKWSASSIQGLSQRRRVRGKRSNCIPGRVMASLLKAHTLVTSKLKSSLMLFIFKCSPLDRRHLVRHVSQGRPRCSALLGSITQRQPLGADTKAVGLTRDLLWNLSQSCTTRRKHKCTHLLVYTHPDLSHYMSPTPASATTVENKTLFK